MIKKIRHPDGTEETVEGTPEEIAAYERKINEGRPVGKRKPPVLKGSELAEALQEWMKSPEFQAEFEKLLTELKNLKTVQWWPALTTPFLGWCSICGSYNCTQLHYTITTGTTIGIGAEPMDFRSGWITDGLTTTGCSHALQGTCRACTAS